MITHGIWTEPKLKRLVCWFSCGATSAVATKQALALDQVQGLEIHIVYCDTGAEHPDNVRFLKDCEEWFGHKITVLKNPRYEDIWDVFKKERYLSGVNGAKCTTVLKKRVRQKFEDPPHDLQVFGFDASEMKRVERFTENNPEVRSYFPLIGSGTTKQDCLDELTKNNIEIPAMYALGYSNNNCIGCVKGQMGYWNKIRVDFPDVFQRMSDMEQELNAALCKSYKGDGKRKRVFLKDLPADQGNYNSELEVMKCGLVCGE